MAQAAKEAVPEVVSTLAIMKRRQRLLISAEVPLVTVLCMVRCYTLIPYTRNGMYKESTTTCYMLHLICISVMRFAFLPEESGSNCACCCHAACITHVYGHLWTRFNDTLG